MVSGPMVYGRPSGEALGGGGATASKAASYMSIVTQGAPTLLSISASAKIVLADQSRERIRQRVQRTLALYQSDPAHHSASPIPLAFVALEDLTSQGSFAPIFTNPEHPGQLVDWLGQPAPEDR